MKSALPMGAAALLLGLAACSQGPNEEAGEGADTAYEQSTSGVTDPGHTHIATTTGMFGTKSTTGGGIACADTNTASVTVNLATTGISIQNAGGGGAHNNVQPTIVLNYLLRII